MLPTELSHRSTRKYETFFVLMRRQSEPSGKRAGLIPFMKQNERSNGCKLEHCPITIDSFGNIFPPTRIPENDRAWSPRCLIVVLDE